jgi:hypothetical protein
LIESNDSNGSAPAVGAGRVRVVTRQ